MKSEIRNLDDFLKQLESEGYHIKFNVQLFGMSGATHSLDILGQSENDRVFMIRRKSGEDASCQIIGIHAVSYDLGLRGACIVNQELNQEAERKAC